MEVHRDVFVSNVAIEDWQPDPELSGDAEAHVLFDTESMSAGLTRYSKDAGLPDPVAWTVPATEVLLVLEGEARIEIEDGPVLELKPGDMACLPKGAVTGWSPSPPASLDGSNPAHAGTPPDRAEGGEVDRRPVKTLLENLDPRPGEYTEDDIPPHFWPNGMQPVSEEFKALRDGEFRDFKLRVDRLVENPQELPFEQLKAMERQEQITQQAWVSAFAQERQRVRPVSTNVALSLRTSSSSLGWVPRRSRQGQPRLGAEGANGPDLRDAAR